MWIAVRAHARLLGHAFVRGPGPAWIASGLFCAVAFGPNGLDPRDVVRMVRPLSLGRLVALAVVVLVQRAGVRSLFWPDGAVYARASVVPLGVQRLLTGGFALAGVAPLPLVLALGRAPLEAAVVAAAAAGACSAARVEWLLAAVVVGMLPGPAVPLALAVLAASVAHAHAEAKVTPGRRASRGRRVLPWPLLVGSTLAKVATRTGPGFALSASAPLLGAWLVRVADPTERRARALSVTAAIAALGATPLARAVGRTARAVLPLAAAAGRPRRVAWIAATAVLATPSLAFAATSHAVEATTSTAIVGVGVVALLVAIEARLARSRRDAALLLPLSALGVVVGVTLLVQMGAPGMAIVLAVASLALASSPVEVPRALDR